MEQQPVEPVARWDQRATAQSTLALLSRQSVLIAVTLQTWAAGCQFDITVSKALDEAGQWAGQYWWDVDRLTADGRGGRIREKRWALGLRPYATTEAAYQAARQAVERESRSSQVVRPAPPTQPRPDPARAAEFVICD